MSLLEEITNWLTTKRTILLLIGIGFLVYVNSLFNGFVWDDEEQVLNNTLIHSISNFPNFFIAGTFNTGGAGSLGGLYYRPAMTTFFSLVYSIFGPNAFFFHLFQLLLHIASTTLVFLLFKRLLVLVKINNIIPSFLVALIFLVHPINVETVVYVSNIQDILYFFFGILAFYLLVAEKFGMKNLIWAAISLFLSVFSKETGFLFFPIIGSYFLFFRKKSLLPFISSVLLITLVYSLMRFLLAGIFFRKHGLSQITILSFWERMVSVPKIIFFYFHTYIFPVDLSINHHWVVNNLNINDFYLPLVIDLGVFGLLIVLGILIYKNGHLSKLYLLFSLWFIVGLGFHLHIFPLDVTVTDRWFYFPQIGLLGMVLLFIYNFRLKKSLIFFGLVFIMILIPIFSIRTIVRNANFKDGLTLFSHDINYLKDDFNIENNLGVELFRIGKMDEASLHFENSTRLSPNWWTNWNNLGTVQWKRQRLGLAKEYYQKAIDNGQYFLAYENMSRLLLINDGAEVSKKFIEESLKVLPQNAVLWQVLALAEYKLGDKEKALQAIKNSIYLQPTKQSYLILQKIQNGQSLEF